MSSCHVARVVTSTHPPVTSTLFLSPSPTTLVAGRSLGIRLCTYSGTASPPPRVGLMSIVVELSLERDMAAPTMLLELEGCLLCSRFALAFRTSGEPVPLPAGEVSRLALPYCKAGGKLVKLAADERRMCGRPCEPPDEGERGDEPCGPILQSRSGGVEGAMSEPADGVLGR